MEKKDDTSATWFWKLIYFLIEPPPGITDLQKKRQSRLLSGMLLIIILLGSISGMVQVLTIPGFLPTFIAIGSAVIALLVAYALLRTRHYLIAGLIASITPSVASYISLLNNPKDQSAFVFLLISVLLSSILLDQRFTVGFTVLNLVGLLILPSLQPAWEFSIVAGKISYHLIIPALIIIFIRHRDLLEHDRRMELIESEVKFRSIFDNSVDAIGVSTRGIHVMANMAYLKMFGYDNVDQLMGKPILDLIAPSAQKQIQDLVNRRASNDEVPNIYETRGIRRDGTEFDMEVHVSTYDLGGELYTVPILRDITERKQTQEKLRVSEEKFSKAFHSSPDSVTLSELESGYLIEVNNGFQNIFGYSREEALGHTTLELGLYQKNSDRDTLLQILREQGNVHNLELIGRHKSGAELTALLSAELIEIDEKKHLITITRDITQSKRTENALKDSQRRLSTALRATKVGAWEWNINTNTTFWSEENYRLMGLVPGSIESTYENWAKCVHPDDLSAAETKVTEAIDQKGELNIEFRVVWSDGSIHWINDIGNLIYDELGNPIGMYGIQMDITDRKQIQQDLETNRQRLAFLLSKSPAVIYSAKADGDFGATFISENVTKQLGYSPEEFINNPAFWIDNIHPEDVSRINSEIDHLFEAGFHSYEYRFRHANGHYLWMQDEMTLVYDEYKNPLEIIGSWVDITDRKLAETEREKLIAELTTKNAELEQFTYTVSHDLKSPLVTITGFLGYLEQDTLSGNFERLKKDKQRISEAVQKMQRLLNEVLELSRIGRMMNSPEMISFNDMVTEALEIVHGRLQQKGVQIHIQPDLPVVYGDRPRLIEVTQNLIDNAAKYMGGQTNPQIEIGQRGEENGKPVLFVKDNGMGIELEHHERVFGLFNKLDARSEGTGVGLALVKRIIEFHGGRIWVESEAGKGSTFLFTLLTGPEA